MTNTIKHKVSILPGKSPTASDLVIGELAINAKDGVLYAKMLDDCIQKLNFLPAMIDYGMTVENATHVEDFGFVSEQPSHGTEYGGI
ncbi:MAG: hypothetical protein ACTSXQ_06070 [Alphaproteobacteria bacterium]